MSAFEYPDLPLAPRLGECVGSLREKGSLILVAEPGSGKTTLLPIALMEDAEKNGEGGILLAEPRRVAAVQAAARVSSLLGEEPGGRIGYSVRGDTRRGKETRVLAVTEGVLLRMVQDDPSLSEFSCVVFDEFHERSVGADAALALCLDSRASLRPDLRIAVMSATLDAVRLAAFLGAFSGSAPAALDIPGAAHPVSLSYEPAGAHSLTDDAARSLVRAFRSSKGDILVFLPGVGEIERLRRDLPDIGAEVLSLHGGLSLEEQRRIVRGGSGKRRIILSTSLAQSSLTVPGVRTVVDAGLARLSRYDPATGMDGLFTERVSAADAEQRAGRAGREGPGACIRLWGADEELKSSPQPEILRADLSPLLLECLVWGSEPSTLPFLDPPPAPSLSRARSLLDSLGLLGADGKPNAEGRRCAAMGAGPRLGTMLVRERGALACACAALLSERDRSGIEGDADLRHRIQALASGEGNGSAWLERARKDRDRFMDALGIPRASRDQVDPGNAGDVLAAAYPDRIARLEDAKAGAAKSGIYRFPSGKTASLAAAPGTYAGSLEGSEWIVAALVDSSRAVGVIRSAAPLSAAFVQGRVLPRAKAGIDVEWKGLSPRVKVFYGYGKIRIPGAARGGETLDPRALLGEEFISLLEAEGVSVLPWSTAARSLLERSRFYIRAAKDAAGRASVLSVEDLADGELSGSAREWLLPYCSFPSAIREGFLPPLLDEGNLLSALSSLVSPFRGSIDREVPAAITLPSGRSVRVEYGEGEVPVIEGKVQEFFGLAAHPRSCGVPLLVRLLSPAGRPVQSTRDIAGFWKNSYADVRKDMRGRYPKHDWPEDGAAAHPSRGPKKRRD